MTDQQDAPAAIPSRTAATRNALATIAVAVVATLLAALVKIVLDHLIGGNAGFVLYVPALAVVAWYRGLLGGLLTTLLTALVDTLIFIPPLLTSPSLIRDEAIQLVVYLASGVVVSYLSHRLREERDRATRVSTDLRRALEEAAATREKLSLMVDTERRANELREAFNGVISHELRTPITAIYGGAKLLARRDRGLEESTRQELIDDLEAEADRLYRLVEDLLVLSRSERGTIERTDDPVVVQHVLERVVRSEQQRWPGVTLEIESRAPPTARGDETYVEQVIRNLLSNAAKYSPAGGVISAIVDAAEGGARVRVLDRGPGISREEASHLFELYYRSPETAANVSGAGIGLFVCRALVEAMGGRVWAAPRDGGGAEFGFVLARHPEA